MSFAALAALVLVACAGPAASAAPPSPASAEPSMASPMTPPPALAFEDGPSVSDPGLLAWLQGQGGRALQLPVSIRFDDGYRLAVRAAWVGAETGGVPLKLDDTALSIALIDQLRQSCPPGDAPCTVWLEGTWGALLSMPELDALETGPKRHDFAVRRFVGLAGADATRVRRAR